MLITRTRVAENLTRQYLLGWHGFSDPVGQCSIMPPSLLPSSSHYHFLSMRKRLGETRDSLSKIQVDILFQENELKESED